MWEGQGETIVITRKKDGSLAGFHNICLHRGARIVRDSGECARRFKCPWHDWVYDFDGKVVGVVANNPQVYGGAMDGKAAKKQTHFMELCDTFHIPIIFLVDVPGFMVGTQAEAAAKELGGPLWVVKSQIHAGGRGKGKFKEAEAGEKGGVRLATSIDDVKTFVNQMLGKTLAVYQMATLGRRAASMTALPTI